MRLARILFLLAAGILVLAARVCSPQVTIAQISDTHLGEPRAPHAAENLRKTVAMVNARHPDAVILTGDIGENAQARQEAKAILKDLKAHLYYVPGNHDIRAGEMDAYRSAFGKDYYRFQIKNVSFVVIDSQLLGNYEDYEATSPPPLPADMEAESRKMLAWLGQQKSDGKVMIGVQHIPVFRDGEFPDPKPYWIISEPYRSREMELLHKLGIKHMLVGHWHNGRVFEREGITWHVAPATSWLPWGGELGFAIHAITGDGNVKTEFVALHDVHP
jgi:DNA repair exonuclease SbcCD nuclease subunit